MPKKKLGLAQRQLKAPSGHPSWAPLSVVTLVTHVDFERQKVRLLAQSGIVGDSPPRKGTHTTPRHGVLAMANGGHGQEKKDTRQRRRHPGEMSNRDRVGGSVESLPEGLVGMEMLLVDKG